MTNESINARHLSERTARGMEIMENLNKAYEEFYKWLSEVYADESDTAVKSCDTWGNFLSFCLDVICMNVRTELCDSNYKSI